MCVYVFAFTDHVNDDDVAAADSAKDDVDADDVDYDVYVICSNACTLLVLIWLREEKCKSSTSTLSYSCVSIINF